MADTVPITPGTGVDISTEEVTTLNGGAVSAQQVQRMAMALRTADSTAIDLPGDATNGLDVDVTRLPALPAGTNNIGDVDVLTLPDATVVGKAADGAAVSGNPVLIAGQDGTNVQTLKTDSTGRQEVVVITLPALVAGTANIGDVDVASIAAGDNNIGNVDIVTMPNAVVAGDVAHDTGDAGNPIKLGARAETDVAGATMVADADRTDVYADIDGVLLVKPLCPFNNIIVERVTITSGTGTALSSFGATASARNMITTIVVHNSSTTDTFVDILDGTGGTVLMTIPLPQKGGAVIPLPVPLRQTTANTALAYQVATGVTTAYLTFIGFKSKA